MGTINYMTSSYITMGLKPYNTSDYEDENGNIDYDLLEMDYEDDRTNIESILSRYSFYYFHVEIKAGYYEGFSLDIENNFSVAFDGWEDKRAAQKEITSLKQCLLECAGSGLVACYPGWCTGYEDYKGTCKAIAAAIKDMREEVKITPHMVTIRAGNGLKVGGIVYIVLFFLLLPFMVLSECVKKNK